MTKMTKTRVIIALITLIVVFSFGSLAYYYANGYRFDGKNNTIKPTGLLVLKSDPDGAQIYIDNELKTATNSTISIEPGIYDVRIEKEGYLPWNKKLTIEKSIVTEEFAHLFKSAPSLTAITFGGAVNPVPVSDMSKISFYVPQQNSGNGEKQGLWIYDMINLPLGFSQEPRKIISYSLINPVWQFSPDDKQIMLESSKNYYLFESSSSYDSIQNSFVSTKNLEILKENWNKEKIKRLEDQSKKAPEEIQDFLVNKTKSVIFSPDERMILFTASTSAIFEKNFIKDFPGASTQKQDRDIKPGKTYIYDIKEDRNFLIDDNDDLIIEGGIYSTNKRRLSFFPTSRHLVLSEENKISIMDYDGTNRQTIYTGSYVAPFAFPALSNDRLIILTNFGSDSALPNLYSLGIK